MLTLESYRAEGFRALSDTDEIPLRSPTILTGGNDGGKTTAIDALHFLLGGPVPNEDDYTKLGSGTVDSLRAEEIIVTGTFSASQALQSETGLGSLIHLRRRVIRGGPAHYEIRSRVPEDVELRGLDSMKLEDLKELAGRRAVDPAGKASAKESWLNPLKDLASQGEQVDAWEDASAALLAHLPRCLVFSSTAEPDPEGQIHVALRGVFDQILDDESYTGPVRDVERKVRDRVTEEAKHLCEHITEHCPELTDITVVPEIAFKEGFRGVEVRASRGTMSDISLAKSGAGRRRRVNLAVWEWVEQLVAKASDADRSVVIAYDEPDTHLDYGHQRELVNLIQRQCVPDGARMIVATHSLNLIDRVSITDVVHLRLENGYTQVERLLGEEHGETQQYLADVSSAMGLRNSVLLHERCFVGVEGATETQALPLLFRLAMGMSLQSAGIALIAGNGNEGALRVAEFLQTHGRRLAFIVDSDSTSGSTRKLFRKEKLDAIGIRPEQVHYVGQAELEDLFTTAQWVSTANKYWKRDDGQEWSVADLAPISHASKFSDGLMNIVRGGSADAPRRKPGYLVALAQTLSDPDEIPQPLRDCFNGLMNLANKP